MNYIVNKIYHQKLCGMYQSIISSLGVETRVHLPVPNVIKGLGDVLGIQS